MRFCLYFIIITILFSVFYNCYHDIVLKRSQVTYIYIYVSLVAKRLTLVLQSCLLLFFIHLTLTTQGLTSTPDVYRRQILTSKVDPSTEIIKYL